jgi:hypothetical protein
MRTVSKSLITLSMCLGLSGAVYAQATPTAVKPSTAETAKSKPAAANVTKDQPAAISGVSANPALKSPKHEHAARVAKPAVEKSNKTETPDAKKLETAQAKETKSNVSKPVSVKKQAASANKQPASMSKPESTIKQPESASKPESMVRQPATATSNVHKPMKHEASKAAEKTEAAKPAK